MQKKHLILIIILGSHGGQSSSHIGEPQPLSVQWQRTLSVRLQGIGIDNEILQICSKIIYEFRLLGNNDTHDYVATYNKVLIVGGGIGDSTLFLAEQLNHTNAEVSTPSYCLTSLYHLFLILDCPS